jgi:hypothetical protein
MLLPGHRELLGDVLDAIPCKDAAALAALGQARTPSSSKDIGNENSSKMNYVDWKQTLVDGLFYPDLPCADRIIRNGRVRHARLRLCSMNKAVAGIFGNRLLEIYASHNGAMSYLHAMAPTPMLKVGQVRDTVLEQILLLFATAVCDDTTTDDHTGALTRTSIAARSTSTTSLKSSRRHSDDSIIGPRPNLFWLGQALHVLMDSYSPAHTLRLASRKTDIGLIKYYMASERHAEESMQAIPPEDRLAIEVYSATAVAARIFLRLTPARRPDEKDMETWVMQQVLANMANADSAVVLARRLQGRKRKQLRARIYDAFEIFVFNQHTNKVHRVSEALRWAKAASVAAGSSSNNNIITTGDKKMTGATMQKKQRLSIVVATVSATIDDNNGKTTGVKTTGVKTTGVKTTGIKTTGVKTAVKTIGQTTAVKTTGQTTVKKNIIASDDAPNTQSSKNRPIVCFFNYTVQDKLFHTQNDLLSKVDKYHLRPEITRECSTLIREFLAAVKDVYPANNQGDHAASSTPPRRRPIHLAALRPHMRKLARRLLQGPLSIAPGFDDLHCNLSPRMLRKAKLLLSAAAQKKGSIGFNGLLLS